ncbi:hypothetical protein MMC17_009311 [Xylographa soralifera]|nr:hypothetical protein [Xylographa soralifera]
MSCPQCAVGALHTGTPEGRIETVHGLPTYIADPPAGLEQKGIIVFLPDAFGLQLVNNKLLADKYARRTNARVYLPDFMNGHYLGAHMFDVMDVILKKNGTWMDTFWKVPAVFQAIYNAAPFRFFNRDSVTKPKVLKFFHDMRANEAASQAVAAAGFCWGGKWVFMLCADPEKAANGKSLVDFGYTAHPSDLVIPQDAEAIKLPLSVCCGDNDMVFGLKQLKQLKEILETKDKEKYEVVIVPGATHGFAVRGSPLEENAIENGRQAEQQAVDWYNKWFEKSKA